MPEAILLLAREFAQIGVSLEVLTAHGIFRNAAHVATLPDSDSTGRVAVGRLDLSSYAAMFAVGPWNLLAFWWAIRARLARVPVIYAPKGGLCRIEFARMRDLRKIPYLILLEFILVALADRVLLTSRLEADTFVVPRLLWRHKAKIIPEPFHGTVLALERRIIPNPEAITFGFLAEISPRKGLQEFVEGFLLFLAQNPEIPARLTIGGRARPSCEGYFNAVRSRVEHSAFAARIEWLGELRAAERGAFYDRIDVFVCPSRFESFGLVPLEAIWHGVPVLLGPCIGVREFLPVAAPASVFPSLDPGAIASALRQMTDGLGSLKQQAASYRGCAMPQFGGSGLVLRLAEALGVSGGRK